MISCSLCGEEIKLSRLNNAFKITLGNFINGNFYGNKSLYYHKNCLVNNECHDIRPLTQIS
jgi:hypothetical protein